MAAAGPMSRLVELGQPHPCTLPASDKKYRRNSLDVLMTTGIMSLKHTWGSFSRKGLAQNTDEPESDGGDGTTADLSMETSTITDGTSSARKPTPLSLSQRSNPGEGGSGGGEPSCSSPEATAPLHYKYAVQKMLYLKVSGVGWGGEAGIGV